MVLQVEGSTFKGSKWGRVGFQAKKGSLVHYYTWRIGMYGRCIELWGDKKLLKPLVHVWRIYDMGIGSLGFT